MSDIIDWLEGIGLGKYAQVFAENEIDLEVLPELSEQDLEQIGLPLGPRRKLQKAIAELGGVRASASTAPPEPTTPQGERRQVTVMFADLSGYTKLSSGLDAEETHALLNQFFAAVDRVVTGYGGTIDKHIGDAVMAVFGAPIAHTTTTTASPPVPSGGRSTCGPTPTIPRGRSARRSIRTRPSRRWNRLSRCISASPRARSSPAAQARTTTANTP